MSKPAVDAIQPRSHVGRPSKLQGGGGPQIGDNTREFQHRFPDVQHAYGPPSHPTSNASTTAARVAETSSNELLPEAGERGIEPTNKQNSTIRKQIDHTND